MNKRLCITAVFAICLAGCHSQNGHISDEYADDEGHNSAATTAGGLPQEFLGTWRNSENKKEQLTIKRDRITWKRGMERTETLDLQECSVTEDASGISFNTTEVAYINDATGEKPRRPIKVELSVEGKELVVVITPTERRTAVPAGGSPSIRSGDIVSRERSGLVVRGRQRKHTYGRK